MSRKNTYTALIYINTPYRLDASWNTCKNAIIIKRTSLLSASSTRIMFYGKKLCLNTKDFAKIAVLTLKLRMMTGILKQKFPVSTLLFNGVPPVPFVCKAQSKFIGCLANTSFTWIVSSSGTNHGRIVPCVEASLDEMGLARRRHEKGWSSFL